MTKLIAALDLPDAGTALKMAAILRPHVDWVKVGLELFVSSGPEMISRLKDLDFKVFLDLKFYDIPNTVAHAVQAAVKLNVDMLTLHLQGGKKMCEAACAVIGDSFDVCLLGVTCLTSFKNGEMPGVEKDLRTFAFELAGYAAAWKLNGIVCSGQEAERIKTDFPELVCVCPGIRPVAMANDDQRRVMTPSEAARAGADYIVVGRPLLASPDPALAARKICQELAHVK